MSQKKRDNKPLTGHKTSQGRGDRERGRVRRERGVCGLRRVPSAAFEPFKYANVGNARNFNSFALLVSVKLLHANLHV